jgi:hypothetical protein
MIEARRTARPIRGPANFASSLKIFFKSSHTKSRRTSPRINVWAHSGHIQKIHPKFTPEIA